MKRYFAYGSNMWDEQMAQRCPQSRKIGLARLQGYRWIITTRGYANVVVSGDDEVEGILFEISESDEFALDKYEGVSDGHYRKLELPILRESNQEQALVYVDPVTEEGAPRNEYITRINEALADAQLSAAYVSDQVRKYIPRIPSS